MRVEGIKLMSQTHDIVNWMQLLMIVVFFPHIQFLSSYPISMYLKVLGLKWDKCQTVRFSFA